MGGWGDIGAAVGKAVAPQAARTGTLSGMRAVATAARAASVGNAAGRAIQSAPQRSAGTAVGYGLGAPTAQHIAAATGNVAGNSLNAQQSQLNDLVRAGLLRSASKPINPGLSMTAKSGFNPLALALPWTIPAALTGKLLPNAAKDVINMPADLLKGGEQLGGALVHDIVHGNFGPENLIPFVGPFLGGEHGHVLGQTLKGAWDQSVAGHLIRGDPAGALDTLQQHPVYGGLELAGELGAAGRGLGALGRSGLVGKTAARAANTEREPLVVVPGQEGLVQHYSPNIFTKAAQVVGENTGLSKYVRENVPTRVGLKMNPRTGNVQLPVGKLMTRQEKLMNQPIDIQRANARQSAQNAHVDTVKAFRQMSKTAGAAKDILPLVAMRTARTPASLIEDLHYRLQDLHSIEQAHHSAVTQEKVLKANQVQHGIEPTKAELDAINAAKLTPKDLKTNQTHQQIIQKSLESPAAHEAAAQLYGGINPATGFDAARGPFASVPNPAFDAPLAEKIKALYERPGSPGEAAAAKEALDRMRPATVDTPLTSQLGLDANTAVHPYVERQHAIEAEKARLGLMDPERMRVREGGVFAQEHIPEVHYDKGGTLSARHTNAMQAQADVRTADKALTQANKASRTPSPELRDARRTLREAHLRESAARARLAETRGYVKGKRGLDPRLTGALYRQLDRHMTKYDAAQDNLASAESAVRQAEAEHLGHHSENIAALTDTLNDAKANAGDLEQYVGDKTKPGLVFQTPNGPIPLRPDIVDRFLGRQGVERPAFVSLKANNATLGQRISSRFSRPSGNTPRTQYETYRKGTYTPGIKGMLQSQLHDLAQIHQAKFFDDVVSHAGIVGPNHQPFRSLDEFHNFADAYKQQTGIDLVPVNARPKAISADQAAKIDAIQDPNVANGTAIQQAQEARLTIDPHSQDEAIIGVPKPQLDRYHTWEAINAKGPGVMGGVNNLFRNSVLPFSAKWVTGNVLEALGRTAAKNHNPADLAIARPGLANRVMERMTPDARANLEANTQMGHHMAMADRANFEREMGHGMGDQSGAWDAATHAPVARQVVQGYQGLLHTIYGVNRKLEGAFDKGLLGQHMRQHVQEFMGSWSKAVKMQSDVMEEMLAQHYANPRLAAEAGQSIRDTLGQYSHFSPGMQRFVQSIAPFAPWYLNAAKFIYHTMPTEHPILTNTMLATSRANDAQWQQEHAGVPHGNADSGMPVGDLLSALKIGDGQFLNLGRYTPAGAFTGGPTNYLASMLAPQFTGAIKNAIAGQDVFGRDLKGPDGKKVTAEKDLLLQALNSLLGSFGGPTQVLSRVIQEHGDTPYNTSKIWDTQLKPGTHHGPPGVLGGVNRVWNPFFPTYLKNSSGQGSGGKSGPSLTTQPRGGSSLTTNSLTAWHPGANHELHPQHAAPPSWLYSGDRVGRALNPVGVAGNIAGYALQQPTHKAGERVGSSLSPQSDRTTGTFRPIPTQIPQYNKGLKLAKPHYLPTGKFGKPGFLRYV